ncbi:unnamed protein product [Arabidopsis halleri]
MTLSVFFHSFLELQNFFRFVFLYICLTHKIVFLFTSLLD